MVLSVLSFPAWVTLPLRIRFLAQGYLDSAQFLNLSTTVWGPIILCCGDCPVHHRMFCSNPSLYTLEAGSNSPLSL